MQMSSTRVCCIAIASLSAMSCVTKIVVFEALFCHADLEVIKNIKTRSIYSLLLKDRKKLVF